MISDSSNIVLIGVLQVTHHELMLERERTAAELETEAKERLKADRREVDEKAYAQMVDVENVNRGDGDVDARNVTDAIKALKKLTPQDSLAETQDLHPEKYKRSVEIG